MASDSEHTNRPRPPQQAQGRKWPIVVLLLGVVTLALALTACGGEPSTGTPGATSAPDATSATGTPEWDETVEFSVVWNETGDDQVGWVEIPVEKRECVEFHLAASHRVEVEYNGPGDESDGGYWGLKDDLHTVVKAEATGTWVLKVANNWGRTTPTNVTVSWLVHPPGYVC